jgi:hypothetical protein
MSDIPLIWNHRASFYPSPIIVGEIAIVSSFPHKENPTGLFFTPYTKGEKAKTKC